ncbi:MAG TPA: OB-fold domain-containing protein [Acidimicrobiales bacterium]|nr:OB-fold domain-containing protein [Acidimicrobiales bacterium]
MTEPARLEPPVTEEAEPFWDATRRQELALPWCRHCQRPFWYPRPVCPTCLSPDVEWRPSSGRGQVYAVSVMHRPSNPSMAERVPYAVALIDLDDGVRMMSNVVGVEAERVEVGMDVTLTWEPLSDGRHLPLFAPVV